jgi:hypothetical protein
VIDTRILAGFGGQLAKVKYRGDILDVIEINYSKFS